MPKVLTEGSMLKCAHQGVVQLRASQSKLKVDGQRVLVQGDLEGSSIVGCTVPVTTNSAPCKAVVSTISGAATRLKADGRPVLLATAMGLTDGVPPPGNLWNVQSAGQTKLDGI